MPEIKIEPKNWEAALDWVKKNARRLRLRFKQGRQGIALDKNQARPTRGYSVTLGFAIETMANPEYLHGIYFRLTDSTEPYQQRHFFNVQWGRLEEGELPSSLEELIALRSKDEVDRSKLKAAADYYPAFNEAYEEIYKRLFPPYEHHELHTDIGDYEESIAIDDALLRQLGKK